MPGKEKRGLLLLIVVAIIIIVVISVTRKDKEVVDVQQNPTENKVVEEFVDVLQDGTKLNNSETLSKTKKLDGLEISNIQLTYNNGISTLLADVKNTTKSTIDSYELYIVIYDKANNVIAKVPGIIDTIEPGQTAQLNTSVTADYANAYDFSVEKK